MKWLIVFYMSIAGPFDIPYLEFETRNECVDYVNDSSNASRLAIEVIDIAGFNDTILSIACLPENEVRENVDETESKV